MLTPPDGKTAYIVQSYTDHIDKGLTMDKLPQLGNLFKLPAGWRFKVKDLDRDLTIAPPTPNYTAHSLVDNLLNVCAGCGFDMRAITFPSLQPSVTTSRSLITAWALHIPRRLRRTMLEPVPSVPAMELPDFLDHRRTETLSSGRTATFR